MAGKSEENRTHAISRSQVDITLSSKSVLPSESINC